MVKKNPPGCFHWKYCHALLPQGWFILLTKNLDLFKVVMFTFYRGKSPVQRRCLELLPGNYFHSKSQKRHWLLKHMYVFLHQTAHMQHHSGCWRRGFPRICVPFAPYRMVVPHAICPEEPRIVTGRWTTRRATCYGVVGGSYGDHSQVEIGLVWFAWDWLYIFMDYMHII